MTKNCNYRKYLRKKLKSGQISGRFYKFLCRNFPYRLTYRGVTGNVSLVINRRMKEEVAINNLKTHKDHLKEMKHQGEMIKSNIECRKKIEANK
jgi:hypothetical protein|tara:strand:- start:1292 stop:1573 length:282 start_codon:yes stop_codon:yes gene_type:complete